MEGGEVVGRREGAAGVGREAVDEDLVEHGVSQPVRDGQLIDDVGVHLGRSSPLQLVEVVLVEGLAPTGQGRGAGIDLGAGQGPPLGVDGGDQVAHASSRLADRGCDRSTWPRTTRSASPSGSRSAPWPPPRSPATPARAGCRPGCSAGSRFGGPRRGRRAPPPRPPRRDADHADAAHRHAAGRLPPRGHGRPDRPPWRAGRRRTRGSPWSCSALPVIVARCYPGHGSDDVQAGTRHTWMASRVMRLAWMRTVTRSSRAACSSG